MSAQAKSSTALPTCRVAVAEREVAERCMGPGLVPRAPCRARGAGMTVRVARPRVSGHELRMKRCSPGRIFPERAPSRHPGAARERSERAGPGRDPATSALALGRGSTRRYPPCPIERGSEWGDYSMNGPARPSRPCRSVASPSLSKSSRSGAWVPAWSRERPVGHSRRRDDGVPTLGRHPKTENK